MIFRRRPRYQKFPLSLAQRIDFLLYNVYPDRRKPYSLEEISRGIQEQSGVTMSPSYIEELHAGTRTNPPKQHLDAIIRFFDIPDCYFDEPTPLVEPDLATLREIERRGIRLCRPPLTQEAAQDILRIMDDIHTEQARVEHAAVRAAAAEADPPAPQ